MERLDAEFAQFPPTREEYVASRLRDAILRGDFVPGDRLDENALAATLGVSRTPIRSALRVLATESLVDLHAHRGAIVTELSPDELTEVYLVRSILESTAARLAVSKLDDERIGILEELIQELECTVDPDQWLALNHQFHTTIYQAANRPRMLSIIEYVRNISTPYIRQFIGMRNHMESSRNDHRRILEACRNRDGQAAESEIKKHLQDVAQANVEFIEDVSVDS